MTTPAQVRAAWKAKVFDHATVQALTSKIYDFDLQSLAEVSSAHLALTKFETEINFIQYQVQKRRAWKQSSQSGGTKVQSEQFVVTVRYILDAKMDTSGTNYNALETNLDTICGLVNSSLGITWNGTVEYYEFQLEEATIIPELLNDVPVWVGEYQFLGHGQATII